MTVDIVDLPFDFFQDNIAGCLSYVADRELHEGTHEIIQLLVFGDCLRIVGPYNLHIIHQAHAFKTTVLVRDNR